MGRRGWEWLLVGLAPAVLCLAAVVLRPLEWAPGAPLAGKPLTVYAYKQWQSTGLDLRVGDQVIVQARGEWLYSPYVGLHGPDGGGRPVTVPTYPLARADGGALLGRVGQAGPAFYVGSFLRFRADRAGRLYLRINDDLLGDNQGALTVTVSRTPAATPDGMP